MADGGEGREGVTVLSEGQLERLADLVAARMAGNLVHHAQRDARVGRGLHDKDGSESEPTSSMVKRVDNGMWLPGR